MEAPGHVVVGGLTIIHAGNTAFAALFINRMFRTFNVSSRINTQNKNKVLFDQIVFREINLHYRVLDNLR